MPITCTFTLNGMPTSILHCIGVGSFPAFSGQKYGRNNAYMTTVQDIGPLPKGRYFIVGRQSGGRLNAIRMWVLKNFYGTDRETWFALYRDDGKINDETFIEGVKRGNFRLHPIGPRGLSEGCVTLTQQTDFDYIRAALLKTTMIPIPGSSLKAYGTIKVN
ncbi:hypothetical protein TI10_21155 [Photorhabdus luminescens subsp. luminescens]|uniref:Tlde1 domain-containing protein n=2 Tax=Photorhabdus luminescens TaxID=29488 RepID=A0A1G5QA05_PHOLU|nr:MULTISPECIES: DUF2778 domain-containing protein [Photorhabdus]KMW71382.1 hypothetical protein TI10_21155 [Photorhabdus luminescens subsp. luminescens]MCW7547441.1 DUF2778 domain-containing protein [Photorhabdus aballayi]MCW7760565.1 DUF2778 domain-containing protein [Photorhabdus luminescens subsp. venezuelensis]SCZ58673.1 Protein of unknown function [Photorhabdus luminescens]